MLRRRPSKGQPRTMRPAPKWRAAHVTRRPILTTSSAAALLLTAVLAACSAATSGTGVVASSTAAATSSATPTESEISDASLAPFACTLPIHGAATAPRAQIKDLRVGAHASYDRIVFTFETGTPEYVIEKAVPPLTQDPSGLPVQVQGSRYLRIVLHGGTVQRPEGGQSYGGPTSTTPQFAKLVDLQSAGDFEAVASWYAGMTADACVRVFTLKAPDRLVIDLQH
jgi:hypothetical protein